MIGIYLYVFSRFQRMNKWQDRLSLMFHLIPSLKSPGKYRLAKVPLLSNWMNYSRLKRAWSRAHRDSDFLENPIFSHREHSQLMDRAAVVRGTEGWLTPRDERRRRTLRALSKPLTGLTSHLPRSVILARTKRSIESIVCSYRYIQRPRANSTSSIVRSNTVANDFERSENTFRDLHLG